MEQIYRDELVAMGGARTAEYAVFHKDGSLYFCTSAPEAIHDESFWRLRGKTLKRVIDLEKT